MIKKIRQRFILTAMLSIAIVLVLIVGGINIANYISINRNIDFKLKLISDNGGKFPELSFSKDKGKFFFPDGAPDNAPDQKLEQPPTKPDVFDRSFLERDLSREAAFDTRYFTVTMSPEGEILSVDTGRIFAIDEETASTYATELFQHNKHSGKIENYKFTSSKTDDNTLFIFLDCERELNTFKSFLLASIGISVVGLLLVFILVFIFSVKITKPMAESYEKQKRFITDASHELKTPLTIIDANTEVLEMTSGENEWTVSTRKQVKRLASLTEKLVFLSRMDEENTRLDITEFSISEAMLDTVEPFKAVAASSGKSLDINVEAGINYFGDEKTIRQLISLLVDNAMKYSSANGEITVSLYAKGKKKIISIRNSVDEIKAGNHKELFERFYRADSSHNSKTGGFGIGLSVAQAIVNAHKGEITAKSDDNKSITFTVTL